MNSRFDVRELKALLQSGTNLMETLRDRQAQSINSDTTVLYSYDVQAGSYVRALADHAYAERKKHAGAKLASIIEELGAASVLDAGTGEGTTLAYVLDHLPRIDDVFAFDISLSRLLFAKTVLEGRGPKPVTLFTSTLSNIAMADGCCDIVCTGHSIEPNGGKERAILEELLRVSARYLVLLEPAWELGNEATRSHIERHGYARGIPDTLCSLGATVVRHELWPFGFAEHNQTALIVAEVPGGTKGRAELRSPINHGVLRDRGSYLHCPAEGVLFPVVEGIPCLLAENAVLAAQLEAALERPSLV